jgi:hypothetical protein
LYIPYLKSADYIAAGIVLLVIAMILVTPPAERKRSQNRDVQTLPGWILLRSSNSTTPNLYWYSIQIYWNMTQENPYKSVSAGYDGPAPEHGRVKVYIFASHPEFYDENRVLSYIQKEAVSFEPVILRPFAATSLGIVDMYNSNLVGPNAVDIYIDPDFKKPDGTSITIKDLQYTRFSDGFSEGSFGVPYDYEDVSIPAVWFVADSKDADRIDSRVDKIREIIYEEIAKCLEFKQVDPERQGLVCPESIRH